MKWHIAWTDEAGANCVTWFGYSSLEDAMINAEFLRDFVDNETIRVVRDPIIVEEDVDEEPIDGE